MKTYLETRLQFVGCSVDTAHIAKLLGLDAAKQITATEAVRLVEVQLSEPDSNVEAVVKAFETWVSDHYEELSAIPADKRDLVLKRYIPQDHGWSFLNVSNAVCRLAGQLGFGVCVVYVTLVEEKTANQASHAASAPAAGAGVSAHEA